MHLKQDWLPLLLELVQLRGCMGPQQKSNGQTPIGCVAGLGINGFGGKWCNGWKFLAWAVLASVQSGSSADASIFFLTCITPCKKCSSYPSGLVCPPTSHVYKVWWGRRVAFCIQTPLPPRATLVLAPYVLMELRNQSSF